MKKLANALHKRYINFRLEQQRSRELEAEMDRMRSDPGLIDRIRAGERPTVFNPGPRVVERPVARPLRSIDGIIPRTAAA